MDLWLRKRLLALGYPDSLFDISSDRVALRTMDDNWCRALHEYLTQLGFPHKTQITADLTTQEWIVVVDWLAAHAIGLMYRDNVDAINSRANSELANKHTTIAPVDASEYTSSNFNSALVSICKLLNIPMHNNHVELLNTIQKVIKSKFLETEIAKTPSAALPHDTSVTEDKFPLGFNTGEKQIDVASTILRLLYIKDLRELQTNINNLIVDIQAFTTNPRTNSTLGMFAARGAWVIELNSFVASLAIMLVLPWYSFNII